MSVPRWAVIKDGRKVGEVPGTTQTDAFIAAMNAFRSVGATARNTRVEELPARPEPLDRHLDYGVAQLLRM